MVSTILFLQLVAVYVGESMECRQQNFMVPKNPHRLIIQQTTEDEEIEEESFFTLVTKQCMCSSG